MLSESHSYAQTSKNFQTAPPLISSEIATVDESFQGISKKTIYYIQDAHDSLEAQENISRTILELVKRNHVKTVYTEGHEGAVRTDDFFGFIKDPAIREKVSYFLLDRLQLGGAEYAHINRASAGDFKLIGADNIQLHLENAGWYRKNAARKKETERDLADFTSAINKLAERDFPHELRERMKLKERFDSHKIDLLDYLKRIYPRDSASQISYPVLSLILSAENSRDTALATKVKAIESKALFQEIDKLENETAARFLKDENSRKIFGYYKGLELLKRLNAIELTPDEFESIKDTLRRFDTRALAEFVAAGSRRSTVFSRRWEKNIKSAMHFYEIARQRDEAILGRLDEFSRNPEEDSAVLVFGGFHKEEIRRMIMDRGFSYAILSPKISSEDSVHRAYYQKLMTRDYSSLEMPSLIARAATPPRPLELLETGAVQGEPAFRNELREITAAAEILSARPGASVQPLEMFPRLMQEELQRAESRSDHFAIFLGMARDASIKLGIPEEKFMEGRILNLGLETVPGSFDQVFSKTNLVTELLKRNVDVVGLDAQAPEDSSGRYVRGLAQKIPFPDASFDEIVTVGLFDPGYPNRRILTSADRFYQEAAAEAFRVLKPGGRMFVEAYSNSFSEHVPEFETVGFRAVPLTFGSDYIFLKESRRSEARSEWQSHKDEEIEAATSTELGQWMSAGLISFGVALTVTLKRNSDTDEGISFEWLETLETRFQELEKIFKRLAKIAKGEDNPEVLKYVGRLNYALDHARGKLDLLREQQTGSRPEARSEYRSSARSPYEILGLAPDVFGTGNEAEIQKAVHAAYRSATALLLSRLQTGKKDVVAELFLVHAAAAWLNNPATRTQYANQPGFFERALERWKRDEVVERFKFFFGFLLEEAKQPDEGNDLPETAVFLMTYWIENHVASPKDLTSGLVTLLQRSVRESRLSKDGPEYKIFRAVMELGNNGESGSALRQWHEQLSVLQLDDLDQLLERMGRVAAPAPAASLAATPSLAALAQLKGLEGELESMMTELGKGNVAPVREFFDRLDPAHPEGVVAAQVSALFRALQKAVRDKILTTSTAETLLEYLQSLDDKIVEANFTALPEVPGNYFEVSSLFLLLKADLMKFVRGPEGHREPADILEPPAITGEVFDGDLAAILQGFLVPDDAGQASGLEQFVARMDRMEPYSQLTDSAQFLRLATPDYLNELGRALEKSPKGWDRNMAYLGEMLTLRRLLGFPVSESLVQEWSEKVFKSDPQLVLNGLAFLRFYSEPGITDTPRIVERLREIFEGRSEFGKNEMEIRSAAFLTLKANAHKIGSDYFDKAFNDPLLNRVIVGNGLYLHEAEYSYRKGFRRTKAFDEFLRLTGLDYEKLRWNAGMIHLSAFVSYTGRPNDAVSIWNAAKVARLYEQYHGTSISIERAREILVQSIQQRAESRSLRVNAAEFSWLLKEMNKRDFLNIVPGYDDRSFFEFSGGEPPTPEVIGGWSQEKFEERKAAAFGILKDRLYARGRLLNTLALMRAHLAGEEQQLRHLRFVRMLVPVAADAEGVEGLKTFLNNVNGLVLNEIGQRSPAFYEEVFKTFLEILRERLKENDSTFLELAVVILCLEKETYGKAALLTLLNGLIEMRGAIESSPSAMRQIAFGLNVSEDEVFITLMRKREALEPQKLDPAKITQDSLARDLQKFIDFLSLIQIELERFPDEDAIWAAKERLRPLVKEIRKYQSQVFPATPAFRFVWRGIVNDLVSIEESTGRDMGYKNIDLDLGAGNEKLKGLLGYAIAVAVKIQELTRAEARSMKHYPVDKVYFANGSELRSELDNRIWRAWPGQSSRTGRRLLIFNFEGVEISRAYMDFQQRSFSDWLDQFFNSIHQQAEKDSFYEIRILWQSADEEDKVRARQEKFGITNLEEVVEISIWKFSRTAKWLGGIKPVPGREVWTAKVPLSDFASSRNKRSFLPLSRGGGDERVRLWSDGTLDYSYGNEPFAPAPEAIEALAGEQQFLELSKLFRSRPDQQILLTEENGQKVLILPSGRVFNILPFRRVLMTKPYLNGRLDTLAAFIDPSERPPVIESPDLANNQDVRDFSFQGLNFHLRHALETLNLKRSPQASRQRARLLTRMANSQWNDLVDAFLFVQRHSRHEARAVQPSRPVVAGLTETGLPGGYRDALAFSRIELSGKENDEAVKQFLKMIWDFRRHYFLPDLRDFDLKSVQPQDEWVQRMVNQIRHLPTVFLLARSRGQLAGYAMAHIESGTGKIDEFALLPDFRNQPKKRYGRRLFAYTLDWLQLRLNVVESANPKTIQVYDFSKSGATTRIANRFGFHRYGGASSVLIKPVNEAPLPENPENRAEARQEEEDYSLPEEVIPEGAPLREFILSKLAAFNGLLDETFQTLKDAKIDFEWIETLEARYRDLDVYYTHLRWQTKQDSPGEEKAFFGRMGDAIDAAGHRFQELKKRALNGPRHEARSMEILLPVAAIGTVAAAAAALFYFWPRRKPISDERLGLLPQRSGSSHFSALTALLPRAAAALNISEEKFLEGSILNVGLETHPAHDTLMEDNIVTELRLQGRDAVGLDPQVENDPEKGYYRGGVQKMPFKDGEKNLVISVGLFDPAYGDKYSGFYRDAANEIFRVLGPGGKFLVDAYSRNFSRHVETFKLAGFTRAIPLAENGRAYLFVKPETTARAEARAEETKFSREDGIDLVDSLSSFENQYLPGVVKRAFYAFEDQIDFFERQSNAAESSVISYLRGRAPLPDFAKLASVAMTAFVLEKQVMEKEHPRSARLAEGLREMRLKIDRVMENDRKPVSAHPLDYLAFLLRGVFKNLTEKHKASKNIFSVVFDAEAGSIRFVDEKDNEAGGGEILVPPQIIAALKKEKKILRVVIKPAAWARILNVGQQVASVGPGKGGDLESLLVSLFRENGNSYLNLAVFDTLVRTYKEGRELVIYSGRDDIRSEARSASGEMKPLLSLPPEEISGMRLTLKNVVAGAPAVELRLYQSVQSEDHYAASVFIAGRKTGVVNFEIDHERKEISIFHVFPIEEKPVYRGQGVMRTILNWLVWEAAQMHYEVGNRSTLSLSLVRLYEEYFADTLYDLDREKNLPALVREHGFFSSRIFGDFPVKDNLGQVLFHLSLERAGNPEQYRIIKLRLADPEAKAIPFSTGEIVEVRKNGRILKIASGEQRFQTNFSLEDSGKPVQVSGRPRNVVTPHGMTFDESRPEERSEVRTFHNGNRSPAQALDFSREITPLFGLPRESVDGLQIELENVKAGKPPIRLKFETKFQNSYTIDFFIKGVRTGSVKLYFNRIANEIMLYSVFPLGGEADAGQIHRGTGVMRTFLNWLAWEAAQQHAAIANSGTQSLSLISLYREYFGSYFHQYGNLKDFNELIRQYGFFGNAIAGSISVFSKPGQPFFVALLELEKVEHDANRYKIISLRTLREKPDDFTLQQGNMIEIRGGRIYAIDEGGSRHPTGYSLDESERNIRLSGAPVNFTKPRGTIIRSEMRKGLATPALRIKAIENLTAPAAAFLDVFELSKKTAAQVDRQMDELLILLQRHTSFDLYLLNDGRIDLAGIPIPKFQKLLQDFPDQIHQRGNRANLSGKKIMVRLSLSESSQSGAAELLQLYGLKHEPEALLYQEAGALSAFLQLLESATRAELLLGALQEKARRNPKTGLWLVREAFLDRISREMRADYAVNWSA